MQGMRRYAAVRPRLGDPPRRVTVRRSGKWTGIWIGRLVSIPFLAAGAWFAWWATLEVGTAVAGTNVTATVAEVRSAGTRRRQPRYEVRYAYVFQGEAGKGTVRVNRDRLEELGLAGASAAGREIPVRALAIGSRVHTVPMTPDGTPGGAYWLLGGLALVWNLTVWGVACAVWIGPRLEQRLYANGVAEEGVVVEKTSWRGKRTHHVLVVEFAADGEVERGRHEVPRGDWEAVREGDRVTVLHRPGSARPNVVYEFGLWRCE